MKDKNELYPLGALSHFVVHDLPKYNTSNKLTDACIKVENLMPDVSLVLHIAYQEPFVTRIRAMGDLGMILVLFSRAGMDAEPVLHRLKLLSETVGVVPRDTYASYVTYNPTNALRIFTGNESEFHFIQSLVSRYIRMQDKSIKYGTGGFPFDSFLQKRIDMIEAAKEEVEVPLHV